MEGLAKKRDRSIDVAKGIGILLVIFGHTRVAALSEVVAIFHMPFFFVLSGIFLSSKLPFHEFVKSRARRILVPYALPQIVRTAQKSSLVGNIEFYAEWRSVSGATPVFNWMRWWL